MTPDEAIRGYASRAAITDLTDSDKRWTDILASAEVFDLTVDRYVRGGGRVWPRLAEHCAEMLSASPVSYGNYALLTGEDQHVDATGAQLNPLPGS